MKRLVIGITSPISVILIKGQLKYFSDKGYKVYLLAPGHPDVYQICEAENATHLSLHFKREISLLDDIWALMRVIYLLIKVSPHIVNMGTPKASLLGIIASWVLRVPKRVYTCRGFRFEHEKGMKRRILVWMEKITGYFATEVICISKSIESMALDQRIFSVSKSRVIGNGSSNGIDLSAFNRARIDWKRNKLDREALLIGSQFVFGFAGRLIDRKGVNELIIAFRSLQQKYSDIVLVIVGHAEVDQLSDLGVIKEIETNPAIISVGWQKDVPRYLSLMDVFVLPAWWEGFGNVLVQAAAMEIPVISTWATGTRDAVSDGFNGVLVPVKDVASLEKAMEKYYLDSKLREVHGRNGRQWASRFESLAVWNGIQAIYDEE